MIVRSWYGRTTSEHAAAYVAHLEAAVFPELAAVPGFRCAYVMRREIDGGYEFHVETAWDSMDAIAAFAGERPELAVVPDAARALLSSFDPEVRHYEVVSETGTS